MKNKTNYTVERYTNAHLSALTPSKRPLMASTHKHVQSVAYSARGYYEATDSDGNVSIVDGATVASWQKILA